MAIDLSKYPLIWCDICEDKKPVVFGEMHPDALNDTAAADIMCGGCRLVIATLHGPGRCGH